MTETLAPEQFFFFRRNRVDDFHSDMAPTRMSAKDCRSLLFSTHGDPDRLIRRMMKGQEVRTTYGTYWAKRKDV